VWLVCDCGRVAYTRAGIGVHPLDVVTTETAGMYLVKGLVFGDAHTEEASTAVGNLYGS